MNIKTFSEELRDWSAICLSVIRTFTSRLLMLCVKGLLWLAEKIDPEIKGGDR